jgi:hypothetical protein
MEIWLTFSSKKKEKKVDVRFNKDLTRNCEILYLVPIGLATNKERCLKFFSFHTPI